MGLEVRPEFMRLTPPPGHEREAEESVLDFDSKAYDVQFSDFDVEDILCGQPNE